MPGPISHLYVGKQIAKELSITDQELLTYFYAGILAPDTIHSRKNYHRDDKKRSHLRQGMTDTSFVLEDQLQIFYRRCQEFIKDYHHGRPEEEYFYKGYLVHLLTDELFLRFIRPTFTKAMDKEQVQKTDIAYRDKLFFDLSCHCKGLGREHPDLREVLDDLVRLKLFEVEDLIKDEELMEGLTWARDSFRKETDLQEPRYLSRALMDDFFRFAARDIILRLTDGQTFSPILLGGGL